MKIKEIERDKQKISKQITLNYSLKILSLGGPTSTTYYSTGVTPSNNLQKIKNKTTCFITEETHLPLMLFFLILKLGLILLCSNWGPIASLPPSPLCPPLQKCEKLAQDEGVGGGSLLRFGRTPIGWA